ncbi:TPA: acyltransferase [Klebsiella oxytoca]|nr:acyltransferase [Klebsiella oxytoca]
MQRKKIYNLQIIRGIAVILVVFEHLLPKDIGNLVPQGQIGVSMFFFISGFVMIYSFKENESGISFFRRRVERIYPAYIILSLPLIIYFSFISGSSKYLFHNLSLIAFYEWAPEQSAYNFVKRSNANPVAWTLYFEMFFYFIFAIAKFFSQTPKGVTFISTSSILLTLMVSNYFYGNSKHLGWQDVSYINIFSNLSLTSFVAGMLFPLFWKLSSDKKLSLAVFIIPLLSWLALKISGKFFPVAFSNEQIKDTIFSSIPSWIFVALLIRAKRFSGFVFDRLHHIGMISYSFYLFHANFYILKGVLDLGSYNIFIQILFFIITFTLSIFVANISFNKIERIKFKPLPSIKTV